MTQEQIQQLFKLGYNQANWKQFLGETFPQSRLLPTPEVLTGIDKNVASKALKLGYLILDENGIERQIAVYEVTLEKGIILERNRVGLRNILRKYWKNIDAAFIIYHNPDNKKWRFTYVSELTGYDSEGAFQKIQTEPKRYTYVLGEGESTRTASERFSIIAKKGIKTTLEDIKEAFSVEKLSKSFFDEYKKHYDLFCDFMLKRPGIKSAIFNGDEKAIRDFNKKLLGRIVFLYFIQKKGWMGVPVGSKWGQGDFNFLDNLFKRYKKPDLFYTEMLTRLFFDTLNTKREGDVIELVKGQPCRIPYLNGGLFEEDDKKHRSLILNAELFKNLFGFFSQYNFTIYEDDPNDHTVAVDPEMLGHIFENLLEDNKDKGAFYTPKEIVHYMCQESLIEYLCTTLNIIDEDKERVAIQNLLKKKEIDTILKSEIGNINKALDEVKICDPAIGSGAFPMGLLQEIFTAKQTLWYYEHGNLKEFPASNVKLNIIQNSIYGVDIEKGAVDIARLRFWLSLVVDEEEPKALPNLDYKIVVGNSLISKLNDTIIDIDWDIKESKVFQSNIFGSGDLHAKKGKLLRKISEEQKQYFSPDSDKRELSSDIRNLKIDLLINQLELIVSTNGIESKPNSEGEKIAEQTNIHNQTLGWKDTIKKLKKLKDGQDKSLNFFDWKLDFPEVLNELVNHNAGFDIVIGNPPYGAKITPNDKIYLHKNYNTAKTIKGVQKGSLDTYTLFIELGHSLIKTNGNLHYIVPISITSSDSVTGVHKLLEETCSIIKLSSYAVRPEPVFENAVVNTSILYFRKDLSPVQKILSTKMYRKKGELNLRHLVDNLEFINISDVKLIGRYPKISLEIEKKILKKILNQEVKIGDCLKLEGKEIYYRFAGGRYFKIITNYSTGSSAERAIKFDEKIANVIGAILSSNLYFWFYQIFSDNLNLKAYEIESFGIPIEKLTDKIIEQLNELYSLYLIDIERNANVRKTTKYANIDSFKEYKIGKSKDLIDKIDDIIAPLYNLNNEELKFIKNYEIQFRLQEED